MSIVLRLHCLSFYSFLFIFAISRIITFFKTTRDPFPMLQRLFSVDEHIVLLEENIAGIQSALSQPNTKNFQIKMGKGIERYAL